MFTTTFHDHRNIAKQLDMAVTATSTKHKGHGPLSRVISVLYARTNFLFLVRMLPVENARRCHRGRGALQKEARAAQEGTRTPRATAATPATSAVTLAEPGDRFIARDRCKLFFRRLEASPRVIVRARTAVGA